MKACISSWIIALALCLALCDRLGVISMPLNKLEQREVMDRLDWILGSNLACEEGAEFYTFPNDAESDTKLQHLECMLKELALVKTECLPAQEEAEAELKQTVDIIFNATNPVVTAKSQTTASSATQFACETAPKMNVASFLESLKTHIQMMNSS